MAAEGDVIFYTITAVDDEWSIPDDATHVSAHKSVTVIPPYLFNYQNILELILHSGVKRIRRFAYRGCTSLRRIIIPGVEIVEACAFAGCESVTDIECPKLEIIGADAFNRCESLLSIDLPSAKIVRRSAFAFCAAMKDVNFGKHLVRIEEEAFYACRALERITIPLKNGLITDDDIFQACEKLHHINLVEGEVLHQTIDALQLGEWRNDVNEELDSINQILPNARAGTDTFEGDYEGDKARVIRDWITCVLRKVIEYKAEHRRIVTEAATTLQLNLPNDIVTNSIIPFLALSPYRFDGEEEGDDEGEGGSDMDDSDDQSYYSSEENDGEEEEDDEEGSDMEDGDTSSEEGNHEEEMEAVENRIS